MLTKCMCVTQTRKYIKIFKWIIICTTLIKYFNKENFNKFAHIFIRVNKSVYTLMLFLILFIFVNFF